MALVSAERFSLVSGIKTCVELCPDRMAGTHQVCAQLMLYQLASRVKYGYKLLFAILSAGIFAILLEVWIPADKLGWSTVDLLGGARCPHDPHKCSANPAEEEKVDIEEKSPVASSPTMRPTGVGQSARVVFMM